MPKPVPLTTTRLLEWIGAGEAAIEALPSPATPALIYGYGVYGRDLFRILRQAGAQVVGFVDARKAGEIAPETGQPILHPEAVSNVPIIIQSINNPAFDLADINPTLLPRCKHLLNPLQALWWAGTDLLWSARPEHYRVSVDTIAELAGRIHPESQALYAGMWHDRLSGEFTCLNQASGDPYFPADVPGIPHELVLVDCGAFDGDVARDALRLNLRLKGLIAFEPDPENHARLVRWIEDNREHLGPTMAIPVAVGERNEILSFASGLATSSHVSADGSVRVPCLRLDDLLVHYPVDYIKFDVEGAEAQALLGAADTIRRQRPALAVSIYHRPDDLYQLPALIDRIAPGYEFRLRLHALAGIDTLLYATRPFERS